jgi:hypothetical protein
MQPDEPGSAKVSRKLFRVSLPQEDDRVKALQAARRLERDLAGIEGAVSVTRAGQHMSSDSRLFFYFRVARSAVDSLRDIAAAHNASLVPLPAVPRVDDCPNCGNVAEKSVAVCPTCKFREISACPICHKDSGRQEYRGERSDSQTCPRCGGAVALEYNPTIWLKDGRFNQPIVCVKAR